MLRLDLLLYSFCLLPTYGLAMGGIYCGDENCYDVLEINQTATLADVRASYRKLARTLHPDKNPSEDAAKEFRRVAAAYEILSDERTRAEYEDALAHPERAAYNAYRYYNRRVYKYWQTDAKAVVAGTIGVLSVLQYAAKWVSYNQVLKNIKATPRYRNRLKQLQEEALQQQEAGAAGSAAKRKGVGKDRRNDSRKLSAAELREIDEVAELEIDVKGGFAKPTFRDTIGWQLVISPYTALKRWVLKYRIRKEPYDSEDQTYLTRHALSISQPTWDGIPEQEQRELLERQLWVPANLANYYKARRRR